MRRVSKRKLRRKLFIDDDEDFEPELKLQNVVVSNSYNSTEHANDGGVVSCSIRRVSTRKLKQRRKSFPDDNENGDGDTKKRPK